MDTNSSCSVLSLSNTNCVPPNTSFCNQSSKSLTRNFHAEFRNSVSVLGHLVNPQRPQTSTTVLSQYPHTSPCPIPSTHLSTWRVVMSFLSYLLFQQHICNLYFSLHFLCKFCHFCFICMSYKKWYLKHSNMQK
jgi:hypothetical protein